MARLSEQELICTACKNTRELPICCGKEMEHDGDVFFCEICDREIKPLLCCNKAMVIHTKVRDIRKELFQRL